MAFTRRATVAPNPVKRLAIFRPSQRPPRPEAAAFAAGPTIGRALTFAALATSSAIAIVALAAGIVRLLPFAFEPTMTWRVLSPFARGLASVALEASMLIGWPLGWALAAQRMVDRGEALVLASLGESPTRTVLRAWPHALLLSSLLFGLSSAWGNDARSPGRVATELVAEARAACEDGRLLARPVPLLDASWLCFPPRAEPPAAEPKGDGVPAASPRLVGRGPGGMSKVVFSSRGVELAPDLRRIELEDARFAIAGASVHAAHVTLRGLPPWAKASTLPSASRATLLVLSALAASFVAASGTLALRRSSRFVPVFLGGIGPTGALFALRVLEQIDASPAGYVLVPIVAYALTAALLALASRLPRRSAAATS